MRLSSLFARLQAQAKPQSLVAAPTTHRLTEGLFDYESLGQRELKGIAEPVEIWQAVGVRAIESRFQATHLGHLTPLIGRDEELSMMHRRWTHARDGEGEVVLIAGEPGIGKSRLTETLRERVSSDPHLWLNYQCSPHHVNSPVSIGRSFSVSCSCKLIVCVETTAFLRSATANKIAGMRYASDLPTPVPGL